MSARMHCRPVKLEQRQKIDTSEKTVEIYNVGYIEKV